MVLAEMEAAYPAGVLDGTFITNHDMPRIATQLGNDPTGLDLAASILLTLPGTPFLYYGEEIGMTGDKPDPDIRTPMQWRDAPGAGFTDGEPWRPPNPDLERVNVASQTDDPRSLLSHYRRLIQLRALRPALRSGILELLDAPDAVLAFVRSAGDDRVLVVHNLSARELTAGPWLPGTATITVEPVGQGGIAHLDEHGVRVELRPRASAVISLD
jgi:glycosidase